MQRPVPQRAMGWLPDYPDFRDYTIQQVAEKGLLAKTSVAKASKKKTLTSIDLRPWCSPVENQEALGSCTAHAGVGMVEYFEMRAFSKHMDASRLFLYKVTRDLVHWTGDTGAFLRSTMGALALFGVPPEDHWPYITADYDKEPPSFCFAFAQNYQAINYYRLDPPGIDTNELLKQIKTNLVSFLPAMFGFTVYSSYVQAGADGAIPYPTPGEKVIGGHAVMAVGYDDAYKVTNKSPNGTTTKGALLVRNSWGTGWGNGGYGWLPYDYVLGGLAIDWWTLAKSEWIDTGAFHV